MDAAIAIFASNDGKTVRPTWTFSGCSNGEVRTIITKRRTAWTALARIGQKGFSALCVAPRLAIITISAARICSAMRRKRHGGRGNRRVPNGDRVSRVAGLAMQSKPSVDFSGYWQRHVKSEATT